MLRSEIPIYIPCFNNLTYLRMMISQLWERGCENIVANLMVESSLDLSEGEPTFIFVNPTYDLDWGSLKNQITALLVMEDSEPMNELELADLEIIPLERLKEQYWEEL